MTVQNLGSGAEENSRLRGGFLRHFHGCRRVLDLGSGVGGFAALLASRGIEVVCVDASAEAVAACRRAGLTAHSADAVEFLEDRAATAQLRVSPPPSGGCGVSSPRTSRSCSGPSCVRGEDTPHAGCGEGAETEALRGTAEFDGVWCAHLIEHLDPPRAQRLLMGAARVLRHGGILVLLTPNAGDVAVMGEAFWEDPGHVRPYPKELLRGLAAAAGLGVEEIGEMPPQWLEAEPPLRRLALRGRGLLARALVGRHFHLGDVYMVARKGEGPA